MNRQLAALAERRRLLAARAALQRAILAHDMQPWRTRLALADQGMAALRYVGRHPLPLAAATLLLVALRPRPLRRWLQRGWLAWRIGRRLRWV